MEARVALRRGAGAGILNPGSALGADTLAICVTRNAAPHVFVQTRGRFTRVCRTRHPAQADLVRHPGCASRRGRSVDGPGVSSDAVRAVGAHDDRGVLHCL